MIVRATGKHPLGGLRATEIAIKPDAFDVYEARLSARDAEINGRAPKAVVDQAATSAMSDWIVVLLDDPIPREPQAFIAWAKARGLLASAEPRLLVGGQKVLVVIGSSAFPRAPLETLGVDDGLDPGRGFLGLSLGLPETPARLRSAGRPKTSGGRAVNCGCCHRSSTLSCRKRSP